MLQVVLAGLITVNQFLTELEKQTALPKAVQEMRREAVLTDAEVVRIGALMGRPMTSCDLEHKVQEQELYPLLKLFPGTPRPRPKRRGQYPKHTETRP